MARWPMILVAHFLLLRWLLPFALFLLLQFGSASFQFVHGSLQLGMKVIDLGDTLRLQTLANGLFVLFDGGKLLFELLLESGEVGH